MDLRRIDFKRTCLTLVVILTSCVVWGQAGQTTVVTEAGIKVIRNAAGTVMFSGVTADVAPEVVVPATATFPAYGDLDITLWREYCLVASEQEIAPGHIVSIKSEDSQSNSRLRIYGNSIAGWTELQSIEFPAHLAVVDCDFINNCPKLESITFHSPEVVEFDSEAVTTEVELAAKPVLYVQPELVDKYKELKASATGYARYFLSQCSDIRPIGGESTPRGVHILLGDLHLNMIDARPGDKITIAAPEGETIISVAINEERIPTTTGTQTMDVTLPEFKHNMVMTVKLSNEKSLCTDAIADAQGVRVTAEGVTIDNYDGSMVYIMDLTGRIIAQGHRSTYPLAKGIYILIYASQGHKISIR